MGNIGLLATICLALATGWLGFSRYRMRMENNWPLVYMFSLVAYLNVYSAVLHPYVVYVAVVAALLLRFEFLNSRLVLFVRVIESVALAHTAFRLLTALQKELR